MHSELQYVFPVELSVIKSKLNKNKNSLRVLSDIKTLDRFDELLFECERCGRTFTRRCDLFLIAGYGCNCRQHTSIIKKHKKQIQNPSRGSSFKKDVLKRDGHKCTICNHDGGEVGYLKNKLVAHHLDSINWSNNDCIENGVTLCESCHKEFHSIYGVGNNTKEQFESYKKRKKSLAYKLMKLFS